MSRANTEVYQLLVAKDREMLGCRTFNERCECQHQTCGSPSSMWVSVRPLSPPFFFFGSFGFLSAREVISRKFWAGEWGKKKNNLKIGKADEQICSQTVGHKSRATAAHTAPGAPPPYILRFTSHTLAILAGLSTLCVCCLGRAFGVSLGPFQLQNQVSHTEKIAELPGEAVLLASKLYSPGKFDLGDR